MPRQWLLAAWIHLFIFTALASTSKVDAKATQVVSRNLISLLMINGYKAAREYWRVTIPGMLTQENNIKSFGALKVNGPHGRVHMAGS